MRQTPCYLGNHRSFSAADSVDSGEPYGVCVDGGRRGDPVLPQCLISFTIKAREEVVGGLLRGDARAFKQRPWIDSSPNHRKRTAHGRIQAHQVGFSRRLQLAPGLVPPSSWSLSPCIGPEIHWRAKVAKSPGPGAIYLQSARSARNLAVQGRHQTRQAAGAPLFSAWPTSA